MRSNLYGKLQLLKQPYETRRLWSSRHDEPEPSPAWGLSCLYEYDPTELFEVRDLVQKLLEKANLTPREQEVIELCVCKDYTLAAAERMIGVSTRERVWQIREKALRKLRAAYRAKYQCFP